MERARSDDRVMAVLDYGSTSEGRGDGWSDIDLALMIRPDAWDDFHDTWRNWLESCGTLLLGFISFVDHPWAVMATSAAPVRVDLHLYGGPPDIDLVAALPTWPNAPVSVDAMLLFDRDNILGDHVAGMTHRSLAPADPGEAFVDVAAHFWYYLHRTWCKLQRQGEWAVRWNLTNMVTGNLCALMRLESGATRRWAASDAADGIETAIPAARLAALNRCVPGSAPASLAPALQQAAMVGADVCETLSMRLDKPWPHTLAREMLALLAQQPAPYAES